MIARRTGGLVGLPGHTRTKRGWLYLTNNHEVIEYPTIWAAEVAKRKSHSAETLEQYGSTLGRWLQFLDDNGYRAENWQTVDRDVAYQFLDTLIAGRDELGRPVDETIESYMARITDFYRCATKAGYKHYWDMDNEEFSRIIKDKTETTEEVEITGLKKEVKLSRGKSTSVKSEMNKFVHEQHLNKAMGLFDDYVYVVMAYVIRNTALRPKELFQLPYKGVGKNDDLAHHRIVIEETTDENGNKVTKETLVKDKILDGEKVPTKITGDINFTFESKGKNRSIMIPLHIWKYICKVWMPERNRRAEIYREKHKVGPGNNCLFISVQGCPVTYDMLIYHFNKVAKHPEYVKRPFTPKMLRHSWATYYVYLELKKDGKLNSGYEYNYVHDEYLRKYMGHSDITTTYKYYVHLVQICFRKDVMGKILEEANRELNSIVEDLAPKQKDATEE
jgi:site-specific recombinase XerD